MILGRKLDAIKIAKTLVGNRKSTLKARKVKRVNGEKEKVGEFVTNLRARLPILQYSTQ